MAYRLTGNHADAQDLVQEVLLRAQRGLGAYRPGSMEGWLSRITTNAFIDEVRRRRRRPVESYGDDPIDLAGSQDVEYEVSTQSLSYDLQHALLRLPEEFRVAVVLCDVVGLSYDEIGEQLGIPLGTVRSRIHRGRTALRKELA